MRKTNRNYGYVNFFFSLILNCRRLTLKQERHLWGLSVSEFFPSHPIVQKLDSGSSYIYSMHILHVLQTSYSMWHVITNKNTTISFNLHLMPTIWTINSLPGKWWYDANERNYFNCVNCVMTKMNSWSLNLKKKKPYDRSWS